MGEVKKDEIIAKIHELFADRSIDLQEAYDLQCEIRDAATSNARRLLAGSLTKCQSFSKASA